MIKIAIMSVLKIRYLCNVIYESYASVRSSNRQRGKLATENKSAILEKEDIDLNQYNPFPKLSTRAMGTIRSVSPKNSTNKLNIYLLKRISPKGLILPFFPLYFSNTY